MILRSHRARAGASSPRGSDRDREAAPDDVSEDVLLDLLVEEVRDLPSHLEVQRWKPDPSRHPDEVVGLRVAPEVGGENVLPEGPRDIVVASRAEPTSPVEVHAEADTVLRGDVHEGVRVRDDPVVVEILARVVL